MVRTVTKKTTFWDQHKHLFTKEKKNTGAIGGAPRKVKDLGRFVKWPRYIRLQRQRAILKKRLKTPPAINQFVTRALNVQQAGSLLKVLRKYSPETRAEKKVRLQKRAEALEAGQELSEGKPTVLKFGMNHVTKLIETKKAKLVVIAHDVDPIELIVWMPALCKAMDIPYVIVKGKATLGSLVHQKTAACVALTDINKGDLSHINQFISNFKPQFNDLPANEARKWGNRQLGQKTNNKLEKLRKAKNKETVGLY